MDCCQRRDLHLGGVVEFREKFGQRGWFIDVESVDNGRPGTGACVPGLTSG